jgi:hypothetical protein
MQSTINLIYNTVKTKRKRERFETILEPLQAILQIGYLSFAPIGTKLTIQNNILKIQIPNYSQSVVRWYNNDTQEDLFYLFNIFNRFKKFYHFLNESKQYPENKKLYDLLIDLAISGIGNLIRTYSQTDKIHILHTLQMYKTMLEKDENDHQKRFDSFEIHQNLHQSHASHASHAVTQPPPATSSYSVLPKKSKGVQKILRDDSIDDELENTKETTQQSSIPMAILQSESSSHEVKNIDDVFVRITDLYTQELYNIIYNSLIIMTKNDTSFNIYIDGLNKILEPTNNTIKKWIDENIVF